MDPIKIDIDKNLRKVYKEFSYKKRRFTTCIVYRGTIGFDLEVSSVNIGISVCNPDDKYNKKLGQHISYERAKKAKGLYISMKVRRTYGSFIAALEEVQTHIKENLSLYVPSA